MKVVIRYFDKNSMFVCKVDKFLFINFIKRKKRIDKNSLITISLITYNYILFNRILRQFGLAKPLINIKDYNK